MLIIRAKKHAMFNETNFVGKFKIIVFKIMSKSILLVKKNICIKGIKYKFPSCEDKIENSKTKKQRYEIAVNAPLYSKA